MQPRLIRIGLIAWLIVSFGVAACEPTQPPVRRTSSPPASIRSPAATAGPSGGTSAAPSAEPSPSVAAPTGSPLVTVSGDTVTIVGRGEKNTAVFPLDGTYRFKSSACPGTGVIPFVWVYEEFGTGRGTYVDAEFTVKNLKGNFYLRIQGPPTCEWTVTLTKE